MKLLTLIAAMMITSVVIGQIRNSDLVYREEKPQKSVEYKIFLAVGYSAKGKDGNQNLGMVSLTFQHFPTYKQIQKLLLETRKDWESVIIISIKEFKTQKELDHFKNDEN